MLDSFKGYLFIFFIFVRRNSWSGQTALRLFFCVKVRLCKGEKHARRIKKKYFVKAPTRVREWVYGYQRVNVFACACLFVSVCVS